MAKLPQQFNFGDTREMDIEDLVRRLQVMYRELAEAINRKPDFYERTTDGQASDTFLSQGTLNLNSTSKKVEMLTEHVSQTVVSWTTLS